MFMSAQEQMDKAIENNGMVSVKAAIEMLDAVTKKLEREGERVFIIYVVANIF